MRRKMGILGDLFMGKGFPYNFFAFGEDFHYYSSHGKISSTLTFYQSNEILNTIFRIDRGKLLDAFSKIEFLLGYIIFAKVNNYENINFFDKDFYIERRDIIDSINFSQRIKFIESWKLIKRKESIKLFEKIYNLKQIRNQVAHFINIDEISYNDKLLKNEFNNFKKDINDVWMILLDIYNSIRNQESFINYMVEELKKDEKNLNKMTLKTE
ncbi:MAG: hypothetical protein WAZ12_01195 [Candidatus Absconditicoccaceae bacterium]